MNCLLCGDEIPEGKHICWPCEMVGPKELVSGSRRLNISIPYIPPSNNKYMGRGTRYIQSIEYQKEKTKWAWLINSYAKIKPSKPIEKAIIDITYYFKTRHRRDPDNYSGKFILDGLTASKIIIDDSFDNVELVLKGKLDRINPRTEIMITEVI